MESSTSLGTESIGKLFVRLSVPSVIAQIINMLYNIVDRIYIGHISGSGADALTGLGVCAPIILIIAAFSSLVFFGSAARASMSMGRGSYGEAEKIMGNSLSLLVAVSLILTAAVIIFCRPMLLLFGASDKTIDYAVGYIRIYAVGTLFVSITLGMNSFITAQGFAKISMLTVSIGAVCNIILDPIFIYAFKLGVQGAALATIISQAVSMIWVLHFLTGKKTILKLRRRCLKVDWQLMLPCISLGVSPFIMQSTEGLLSVCFNSSLLKYGGNTAVGAMTILSTVTQCTFLVLTGLTQGAQPIISYNYGARNSARVKRAFRIQLYVCVAFSVAVWICVMLFPSGISSLLTNDESLRRYAAWAMRIYCASSCIFGIQTACQQTFIGIGNAKASVFLAVLRKLILLIPLIYILPHIFANQVMAVYLAEPVADTIAVSTTAIMFAVQFKKAMKEIEDSAKTSVKGPKI